MEEIRAHISFAAATLDESFFSVQSTHYLRISTFRISTPKFIELGSDNRPSLLDRNWLQKITLNSIWLLYQMGFCIRRSPRDNWKQKVEAILDTHKNVFKDGLGKLNTFEAVLQLKPGVIPTFSSLCFKSNHRKGIRQTRI